MAQQVAWSTGKPGKENLMLYVEADTAAYYGKLAQRAGFFAPGGNFRGPRRRKGNGGRLRSCRRDS